MAVDPVSGAIYDLAPLTRTVTNWIVVDEIQGNYYTYRINMCRALVSTQYIGGDCASGT